MLYNWDKAPEWAQWGARDSNGFAHWFEYLPYPYFSEFGVEWIAQRSTQYNGDCDPFWFDSLHCPDAKLSLEARPTAEQFNSVKVAINHITQFLEKKEVKYNRDVTLNMYLKMTDRLFKLSRKLPTDPLEPFLGKQISVERPNDTVIVSIFRYKASGRFSFINHTKNHICPCLFQDILEAFDDLEEQRKLGKVISWKFIKSGIKK